MAWCDLMTIEALPWRGEKPDCPKCMRPVETMAAMADNWNHRLVLSVGCHGEAHQFAVQWEEIRGRSLMVIVQERVVQYYGRATRVPAHIEKQVERAAEIQTYERPKRKITLEEE